MAHKRRPEFCNRAGSRPRYAILHQPDLCRARSFHPAPSNRADSRSKSIRNRSGSPVVGNYSRSPAAAAGNTAPWRARVCQTRLRQRSQQPRVLNKKGDEMCTTARSHVTVTVTGTESRADLTTSVPTTLVTRVDDSAPAKDQ
jgi:hypothetical protein